MALTVALTRVLLCCVPCEDYNIPGKVTDAAIKEALDWTKTCMNLFSRSFEGDLAWRGFMVASDAEVVVELEWANARPSVKARRLQGDVYGDPPDGWLHALTPVERANYEAYQRLFPGEACDVNQNAAERPMRTRSGRFFTLIRNLGLVIDPELERGICGMDFLTLMGYPVAPITVDSTGGAICQFTRGYTQPSLIRTVRSVRNQCGNAMHVACIGAVQLLAILKLPKLGTAATAKDLAAPSDRSDPSHVDSIIAGLKVLHDERAENLENSDPDTPEGADAVSTKKRPASSTGQATLLKKPSATATSTTSAAVAAAATFTSPASSSAASSTGQRRPASTVLAATCRKILKIRRST